MNVDAGLEVISVGSRWCLFRAGRGTLCDVDAMECRKRINSVEEVFVVMSEFQNAREASWYLMDG